MGVSELKQAFRNWEELLVCPTADLIALHLGTNTKSRFSVRLDACLWASGLSLATLGARAWAVVLVGQLAHIQASSMTVGVVFGVSAKLQASKDTSLSQEARLALGFTLNTDLE